MNNLSQKWSFPSNNYGQINGIGNSGVETFKGNPIKSLAREICQNSLDAIQNNSQPVSIEFKSFEIEPDKIPGCQKLEDVLYRSQEFWSGQKSSQSKDFFNNALAAMKKSKITCLRISDFNTTGLTGSREEYNSPWCNLTKSSGASDKTGSFGGSFGIGKFAPFACSALRTVFYSTSDIDYLCASQGVARLTSFRDENNEITQGIGFFGNEKNSPMYKQLSLDPDFSRDEHDSGTDIFIAGFTGDQDWDKQMIGAILDGFLYAIYTGSLIINVNGTIIRKDTLAKIMNDHKADITENADQYFLALTDENSARTFTKELTDDPETSGKITLKIIIAQDFCRRVAMIRQTGMKIKDKKNISRLVPFAGVLLIEGEALNAYLRTLENPQHLEWEIERAKNKTKARKLLKSFNTFISASLQEMTNDDSKDALDPDVGEFLSAQNFEESSNQQKSEAVLDSIKDFKVQEAKIISKPIDSKDTESELNLSDDEEGDLLDLPGEGGSGSKGHKGYGGNGGGSNPGLGSGTSPVNRNKKISFIEAINVRSLVRNKDTGEYTIIFTPKKTASNGFLAVKMSAETASYEAPIIEASSCDGHELKISGNKIYNLAFVKNKALKVQIKLDYHDYCSLEVTAYGN